MIQSLHKSKLFDSLPLPLPLFASFLESYVETSGSPVLKIPIRITVAKHFPIAKMVRTCYRSIEQDAPLIHETLSQHLEVASGSGLKRKQLATEVKKVKAKPWSDCDGGIEYPFNLSSSPVKKVLLNFDHKTVDDSCSYDFSQIECYKETKPKSTVRTLDTKRYDVDNSLTRFLKRHDEGILSWNIEDVSFDFSKVKTTASKNRKASSNIEFQIMYYKTHIEAIIVFPKEGSIVSKSKMVGYLHEKLIASQTGPRKYKVLILTPRSEAAWFQRKLWNANIKTCNKYDYILIKTKRSFAKFVKQYITELL